MSNDIAGNLSNNSLVESLKWVPKFAVINRETKSFLLYDYEPSNEIISKNFQSIIQFSTKKEFHDHLSGKQQAFNSNDINQPVGLISDSFRLDNSPNSELFVKYWKNRIQKFDSSNTDRYFKSDDNYLNKDQGKFQNYDFLNID